VSRAVRVVEVPVPLIVIPPGFLVRVHVPEAGSPFRITLPADRAQVGWVIVPMTGAAGVPWALIITFCEEGDTHPEAFVTVKV